MKVNFSEYGDIELIAEDGRDILFLNTFISNIPKKDRNIISKHLDIDLDSSCIVDNQPATECSIYQITNKKGEPWGSVTRININSFRI